MAIFAYTTTRYLLWSLIIFSLHVSGTLTIFTLFIACLILIGSNYFVEKTGQEKEFNNKLAEWLWMPILTATMVLIIVEYIV